MRVPPTVRRGHDGLVGDLLFSKFLPSSVVLSSRLLEANPTTYATTTISDNQLRIRVTVDALPEWPVSTESPTRILIVDKWTQVVLPNAWPRTSLPMVNSDSRRYLFSGVMHPGCTMCRGPGHFSGFLSTPTNLGVTVRSDGVCANPVPIIVHLIFSCGSFCDSWGYDDGHWRFSIAVSRNVVHVLILPKLELSVHQKGGLSSSTPLPVPQSYEAGCCWPHGCP